MGFFINRATRRTEIGHTPKLDTAENLKLDKAGYEAANAIALADRVVDGNNVREMNQGEKDARDASELPSVKAKAKSVTNYKTVEKIKVGFTFEGLLFPFEDHDQRNYLRIAALDGIVSLPERVSLHPSEPTGQTTYSVAPNKFKPLFTAGNTHVSETLAIGFAVKDEIEAAADQATVQAIVDADIR